MGRVELHVYAELVELAGRRDHDVPVGDPRSVKDLIESVGVPHVELGLVVVDDVPVGLDHRVAGGERVAAYPPFRDVPLPAHLDLFPPPPEPRRFVLDVHLGTLARRLRMLGFDTWYRSDTDDAELAAVAIGQGRILLSRDRQLLMRRDLVHGYCPRSQDPELQVIEVVRRYGLVTRIAPLTRCVRCNGRLLPADAAAVRHLLPPRTREEHDTFVQCDTCGQVYWPGSHLDAISGFVERIETAGHGTGPGGSAPDRGPGH